MRYLIVLNTDVGVLRRNSPRLFSGKSDDDLDGSPAKIERENDGKNDIRRKNLRPGEDAGKANPCIWSVRAKVKARRKFPLSWPSIKTDFTTS